MPAQPVLRPTNFANNSPYKHVQPRIAHTLYTQVFSDRFGAALDLDSIASPTPFLSRFRSCIYICLDRASDAIQALIMYTCYHPRNLHILSRSFSIFPETECAGGESFSSVWKDITSRRQLNSSASTGLLLILTMAMSTNDTDISDEDRHVVDIVDKMA